MIKKRLKNNQVDIMGRKVSYYDVGRGKTLLFVHGIFVYKDIFLPLLKRLRNKYRLVAIDLPGFGYSDPLEDVYSIGKCADILNKFCNKLRLKDINIYGSSFGGSITIKFVDKYPQKVKKMILRAPYCRKEEFPDLFTNEDLLRNLIKTSEVNGVKDVYHKIIGMIVFHIQKLASKDSIYEEKIVEKFREKYYKKLPIETITMIFKECFDINLEKELKNIKKKSLILWGAKDELLKVSYAQRLHRLLMNSRLEVFEESSHFPFSDDWEILQKQIENFIR